MAAATVAAVGGPSQQALIIVDDHPVRWRDRFAYVCEVAGGEPPVAGGRDQMPSFRVTNAKARTALAWAPLYSDFRAGLAR